MNEQEFKTRTKKLGLRILRLVEALPNREGARIIGRQLIRSGTSIGANYRAACRGRSRSDVIAKLGVVEEEADETLYWLELLIEGGYVKEAQLRALVKETEEILAMTVASIKTLRAKRDQTNPKSKI